VCGAYLSVLDSDRRLADHFGGKVSFDSSGFSLSTLFLFSADVVCLLDALGISRTSKHAFEVQGGTRKAKNGAA
jgi:hypothetical protein